MKRLIITLALAFVALCAFSQNKILRPRMEIAELESDGNTSLQVFYMDDESPRTYYLSVGHLGIGGDIVQLQVDPLFELFIPLGNSLEEAVDNIQQLKEFCNEPRLSAMELSGSFALAYPADPYETVTVTARRMLLSKILEFSIPREGFVRAVYVARSDLAGILTSLKLYRKLHPSEQ